MITVHSRQGSVKLSAYPSDSDAHTHEIQGDNQLTLSFVSTEAKAIEVGDYVEWEGTRFLAMEHSVPSEVSRMEWRYSLTFYGIESMVKRFLVLSPSGEPTFTLTSPAVEHVRLVVAAINAAMGGTSWKVGIVDATDNLVIDYDGTYCDEALRTLAGRAQAEWWVDGQTVNLTRCEQGSFHTLAYGRGLTSLEAGRADGAKFYTRLYPVGSSRNIAAATYGSARLRLPGGAGYVDTGHVAAYGVIDHFERDAFAHIYPRRIGTMAGVRTEERKVDGKTMTVFFCADPDMDFDPNGHELPGETKRITFQEGSELAGREFECNYNSDRKEFELITQWLSDGTTQLPNGTLAPRVGDRYILWNVRMPESYVRAAEQELLEAVRSYNASHARDISTYRARTDFEYLLRHPLPLRIGQRVRLESREFFPDTGFRESRITKFSRRLAIPTLADIEMGDALSQGAMQRLGDGVKEVEQEVRRVRSGLPDLITTADITPPTDSNIYSARRAEEEFLSARRGDTAHGEITLLRGAKFGEYEQGLLEGSGARIDARGNIEAQSLRLRGFLEVMELLVNRLSVIDGDQLLSEGDTVETVVPDTDASGAWDGRSYILTLRARADAYATAITEGSVLRGIFNDYTQGITHVECWMRVWAVDPTGLTLYVQVYPPDECPGGANAAPRPMMNVARWGHQTDGRRQQTLYLSSREGRIAKLEGVNTPVVDHRNYGFALGSLPGPIRQFLINAATRAHEQGLGYPIPLTQLSDESAENFAYIRNVVAQNFYEVDIEGLPVGRVVNRGAWREGEEYCCNTLRLGIVEISHVVRYGCIWQCARTHTAALPPRWNNTDWALVQGDPDFHLSFAEEDTLYDFDDFRAPLTPVARLHNQDVTAECVIVWTRLSTDADGQERTASDAAWAARTAQAFREGTRDPRHLILLRPDLDADTVQGRPATIAFTATAILRHSENINAAQPGEPLQAQATFSAE